MTAAPRLFLIGLCLLVLAACRIDTNLAVDVRDDGSGTVVVTVRLDDDVVRVPDLATGLRTADLVAAGWQVTGPDRRDGGVTYTATKAFPAPDALAGVLAEITGPDGVLRDIRLSRARSFATSTWTFTATADLSGGLVPFTDASLATALGGKPLGRDPTVLEAELGGPLASFVTAAMSVTLPGRVSADAATVDGRTATWVFQVGDPDRRELRATGRSSAHLPRVWAAVAAAAGGALVVVVVVRAVRRRRPILRAVGGG